MTHLQRCPCGSGQFPSRNYDGYGIFLCYTCDKCHAEKMRRYRSDIMERYECDEPIDGDDESWADECAGREQREYDCE